jgi:hypothetical protein
MSRISDDDLTSAILSTPGAVRPSAARPTDATIAAWAEGRLDAERAALVEAYLATDDAARAEALALRESATGVVAVFAGSNDGGGVLSLDAARTRRATWVPFAAAAAILAAIGVAVLRRTPSGDGLGSDAALVAAIDDLGRTPSGLFDGFRPISAEERRGATGDVNRSGLSILEPSGHVLDGQPTIRWAAPGGAATYEVAVTDRDGIVLWKTSTTGTEVGAASGPRLEPGKAYLVEIAATGPLGRTTATRAFDVATTAEAKAVLAGRDDARRTLGDALGDLAWAHAAARRGYLGSAKAALAGWLASHPGDTAGRELDEYLRRRLGWPEPATAGMDAGSR